MSIRQEDVDKRRTRLTAILISQGNHRFYTLTMSSELLAQCCTVDTRIENPLDGFQRKLDTRRAQDIARYIDSGLGTIPCSIVLSAQRQAELEYSRRTKTLTFSNVPGAFLILDGQHRVYGFALAKSDLRVPVVIYNGLSRADECRLFIDINTKQRPVPNELLLDIKKLAETETDDEAFMGGVFDILQSDSKSPLFGLLSPASRTKGKLSRVTFNSALSTVRATFDGSPIERAAEVLAAYLHACLAGLRSKGLEQQIVNPTLFRALVFLFPDVAQRVELKHGGNFEVDKFQDVLGPFFARLKRAKLESPGNSHLVLHEEFLRELRRQFTIG